MLSLLWSHVPLNPGRRRGNAVRRAACRLSPFKIGRGLGDDRCAVRTSSTREQARLAPRAPAAVRSRLSSTPPPAALGPCAPQSLELDAVLPSSLPQDKRGSTPSAPPHRQRAPARRSVASVYHQRSR